MLFLVNHPTHTNPATSSRMESDDVLPRIPMPTSPSPSAKVAVTLRPMTDAYDQLPEAVRVHVSRSQFAWLSDRAKASLVDDLCTPDWTE